MTEARLRSSSLPREGRCPKSAALSWAGGQVAILVPPEGGTLPELRSVGGELDLGVAILVPPEPCLRGV